MLVKTQYDMNFLLTKSEEMPGSFPIKMQKKLLNRLTGSGWGEGGHLASPSGLVDLCFELCPSRSNVGQCRTQSKILSISSKKGEGETNHFREESFASVKVVKTTPQMVIIARKSVQEKPGWCCSNACSKMAIREI